MVTPISSSGVERGERKEVRETTEKTMGEELLYTNRLEKSNAWMQHDPAFESRQGEKKDL